MNPTLQLFILNQAVLGILAYYGATEILRKKGYIPTLEPLAHAKFDELEESDEPGNLEVEPDPLIVLSLPIDELVWASTKELESLSALDSFDASGSPIGSSPIYVGR